MDKENAMKYYDSIIDIIQIYVDTTNQELFGNDKFSPPSFKVSLFSDEIVGYDKIMLTISHYGVDFTDVIFPRTDSNYGYDSIDLMMKDMYNRSM